MKNVKFILMAVIALSLLGTSCKKRGGCMTKSATNYDESAQVDDGSCKFEAKLGFFLIRESDAGKYKIYIDGSFFGSPTSANVIGYSATNCNDPKLLLYKRAISSSSEKVTVKVKTIYTRTLMDGSTEDETNEFDQEISSGCISKGL